MQDITNEVIEPIEFYDLLKADRLGHLILRENYHDVKYNTLRYVSMSELWKEILDMRLATPKISPGSIHSVIIFGSAANKPPYTIKEGKDKKFLFWNWKEEDYKIGGIINDLDLCVLCKDQNSDTELSFKVGDLAYPDDGPIMGKLHLVYAKLDDFNEFIRAEKHYATQVLKDGIILSDDGSFKRISKGYDYKRKPQYSLKWQLYDKGVLWKTFKKDVLKGTLRYEGVIPKES